MASGFKGSSVFIRTMTLSGAALGAELNFEVLFQDADGVTHGVMKHRIDPTAEAEIGAAAQELLSALTRWTERTHFSSASRSSAKEGTSRGIAEAMSGAVGDPAVFGQDDS
jgi:hypothetical protein